LHCILEEDVDGFASVRQPSLKLRCENNNSKEVIDENNYYDYYYDYYSYGNNSNNIAPTKHKA
jgi:hypothetical protein